MKKNIFITGAAGFIGYHLAKSLQNKGEHVVGYDNFNDYYTPALKHGRAAELKSSALKSSKATYLAAVAATATA